LQAQAEWCYSPAMFGFLNINKPVGPTSQGIIRIIKRRLPRGVRIGHAGTLDPFAQGVLVVCLGWACRLVNFVQASSKTYRTGIILGACSDTDDCRGMITARADAKVPSAQDVLTAVGTQIGSISQVPPAHSAVHVAGQRAYTLARSGQAVELSPRIVDIQAIDIIKYQYPILELEIRCGSGTYIRSIARDIGQLLGCGGYCQWLIRTRIGTFVMEKAIDADKVNLGQDIISPLAALEGVPRISLSPEQIAKVRMGQRIVSDSQAGLQVGTIVLLDGAGLVLALACVQADGVTIQPTRVFALGCA
jgi:tRNA pseudouridine55 synthase